MPSTSTTGQRPRRRGQLRTGLTKENNNEGERQNMDTGMNMQDHTPEHAIQHQRRPTRRPRRGRPLRGTPRKQRRPRRETDTGRTTNYARAPPKAPTIQHTDRRARGAAEGAVQVEGYPPPQRPPLATPTTARTARMPRKPPRRRRDRTEPVPLPTLKSARGGGPRFSHDADF